jgi:hypothetical protein
MCFRLALRALLLAGRAPWLAFLRPRWGLAIGILLKTKEKKGCTMPMGRLPSLASSRPGQPALSRAAGIFRGRNRAFGGNGIAETGAKNLHEAGGQEAEKATDDGG